MSHTTENNTSTQAAIDYQGGSVPESRADSFLREAERIVRSIAPPPEDAPQEYKADASDAELRVFAYLSDSPGHVRSRSAGGVSRSYFDSGKGVYEIVERTMYRWIGGGHSVSTVSRNASTNILKRRDMWTSM